MALKNFFFRENGVASEVAGMKIAFFCHFFTESGPTFWPPKGPNMELPEVYNRVT